MEIPQKVIQQAKNLIDQYGMKIEYLGKSRDEMVFMFKFPENEDIGFPIVYIYKEKIDRVQTVSGLKALKIISNLRAAKK